MRKEIIEQTRKSRCRVVHRGRRRWKRGLFDDAGIRILTGLTVVLTVLVTLARLPLGTGEPSMNWSSSADFDRITLAQPRTEEPEPEAISSTFEASPPVDPRQPPTEEPPDASNEAEDPPENGSSPDTSRTAEPGTASEPLEMVNVAGAEPNIVGGRRALYLHLTYPETARRQGIEGRVVIEFVVDGDGQVHDAEVVRSVHPALDSAAVAAVRRTTFEPGTHQGEEVAVRMHLPVNFKLIDR